MGIAKSPEFFQQKMVYLFRGFQFIPAYMGDLLILTKGNCAYNVQIFELTPIKMNLKGLKCTTEDSFFRQTEMEFLGFWATHYGVKPIDKKIKAINI